MEIVLTVILLPLVVTVLWEFFLRDRCSRYLRAAQYRLVRWWRREPQIGILLPVLSTVCAGNEKTTSLLKILDHVTIAMDGCFELLHSHLYQGWRRNDILFLPLARVTPCPDDLNAFAAANQPAPPNNGKYRLHRLVADSSEDPVLKVQLAATDYFSTYPIQRNLFGQILIDSTGRKCTPIEKYGHNLLDFESAVLPNIVCLHVIVAL